MFFCNKCYRRYASPDGVRKHANKKHTEWIKYLKPFSYSTPCDGVTEWIILTKDEWISRVKPLVYPRCEETNVEINAVPEITNAVNVVPVVPDVTDEDIINLFFEALA